MTDYGIVAVRSNRFKRDLDLKYYMKMEIAPSGQLYRTSWIVMKGMPSPDSFYRQVFVQSRMKFLDYFRVQGSSLMQTSVKVGTCSIFLTVPVLWLLLITSRVTHQLILSPVRFLNLSTDMSCIYLIYSLNLLAIFIIFFTGFNGFRFSVDSFFFYYSFYIFRVFTNFNGYRYFCASLY